jgi:hypothetical protein
MAETRTVGIYLFHDVEALDFAGPFEVFSTASRVGLRLEPNRPKPFEVVTIARSIRAVSARGGLLVEPQFDCLSWEVSRDQRAWLFLGLWTSR